MDIDPPPRRHHHLVPLKKASKSPKFTPKPPSHRKLILPKSDNDSDDDNEEDAKITRELLRKANAVKDNMPDLLSDVVKKKRRQTELSKLKALADVTDKPVVDVVSEPAVKRVVEIQTESHEIQT
ncbi:hypothetical protein Tco_0637717 [Tanacetum coccineum]